MSRVVTPKIRLLAPVTPAALYTSLQMGTVELTGLEIMFRMALGQISAHFSARPLTIPALILNRSSLVMPGFLGTPAGMITKSQPSRQAASSSSPM